MSDQYARIKLGRVDAVLSKGFRNRAAGFGDSHALHGVLSLQPRTYRRHDASDARRAAWCSVTSASMISLSASPSMICGNL